jgi:hypothetical protein
MNNREKMIESKTFISGMKGRKGDEKSVISVEG